MTTAKPRPPLAPGETRAYPVLPLRDIVVFPHMIAPLFVGRKKSILALEGAAAAIELPHPLKCWPPRCRCRCR
jgi:ATP-dependent Lon protease